MGGTDQMDKNVNAYRIGIHGRKWWWSLFMQMIDLFIQNAWQIARTRGIGIDQLAFRIEVAMFYLRRFEALPKFLGRKPSSVPEELDMRYDNIGHLVQPVPSNGCWRCMGEYCKFVQSIASAIWGYEYHVFYLEMMYHFLYVQQLCINKFSYFASIKSVLYPSFCFSHYFMFLLYFLLLCFHYVKCIKFNI